MRSHATVFASCSDDPDGIRTRVAALKGPCPRPLDDGAGHPGYAPRGGEQYAKAAGQARAARKWRSVRVAEWRSDMPSLHHPITSITPTLPPQRLSSPRMLHYFKFRQELF